MLSQYLTLFVIWGRISKCLDFITVQNEAPNSTLPPPPHQAALPSFPNSVFRTILHCKTNRVFGPMSVTSSSNKTGRWVCSLGRDRSSPRHPLPPRTRGRGGPVPTGSGRHISNGFFHSEYRTSRRRSPSPAAPAFARCSPTPRHRATLEGDGMITILRKLNPSKWRIYKLLA